MKPQSGESGFGLLLLICRLQVSLCQQYLTGADETLEKVATVWSASGWCFLLPVMHKSSDWLRPGAAIRALSVFCIQLAWLRRSDQDLPQPYQPLSCFSFNLPFSGLWFFWVNWTTCTPALSFKAHSFLAQKKHTLLQVWEHQGERGVWSYLIITELLFVCLRGVTILLWNNPSSNRLPKVQQQHTCVK